MLFTITADIVARRNNLGTTCRDLSFGTTAKMSVGENIFVWILCTLH